MNISLSFLRGAYLILSIIIGMAVGSLLALPHNIPVYLLGGAISGVCFAAILLGIESWLRQRFLLRSLNILCLGLFLGVLLGHAIQALFMNVFEAAFPTSSEMIMLLNAIIYLACTYFAILFTAQASQEIFISLPFFKLNPSGSNKRDLVLDISLFYDHRFFEFASSGIIDHQAILPQYVVKELQLLTELGEDESVRNKAQRALDTIAKLEALPHFHLRYTDVDFPEIKNPFNRLLRIARHLEANILISDISRLQQSSIEGAKERVISLQGLSNFLKPLIPTTDEEYLTIKIQRQGKEDQQGVGYLADGTMAVVNGGAPFIGKTIRAQYISSRQTSSGRMIFCNAIDESGSYEDASSQMTSREQTHMDSIERYFS